MGKTMHFPSIDAVHHLVTFNMTADQCVNVLASTGAASASASRAAVARKISGQMLQVAHIPFGEGWSKKAA